MILENKLGITNQIELASLKQKSCSEYYKNLLLDFKRMFYDEQTCT